MFLLVELCKFNQWEKDAIGKAYRSPPYGGGAGGGAYNPNITVYATINPNRNP